MRCAAPKRCCVRTTADRSFWAASGRVPQLRGEQAGVAVAAVLRLLPEVGQQDTPTAAGRLCVPEHRVELDPVDPLVLLGRGRRRDEGPLLHEVGEAVRHPRLGRLAVAAGPSGLLVVALEALRQVEVRDEAHVRLVDAHPEGDRGDDDDAVLAAEALLDASPRVLVEPGVIRPPRRSRPAAQPLAACSTFLRDWQYTMPVSPRLSVGTRAQERQQLLPGVLLLDDGVADVGAVEAGHELRGTVERQPLVDLAARDRIGRRGEGDARSGREALAQGRQPQVLRPEVVPPLGDAVRLVDREEREARTTVDLLEDVEEVREHQPLGCHVQQVELASEQLLPDGLGLLGRQARVPEGGAHAEQPQGVDLVLHERDEGRHNDPDAGQDEGGDLVAQRLAPARGHEHHAVQAVEGPVDDLLLPAAEAREAEGSAQDRPGRLAHVRQSTIRG